MSAIYAAENTEQGGVLPTAATPDSAMLTYDSRVRIAPGVVFNEVPGEMVLLNTTTGRYYALDAVASRMWHLLRQEADLGQVLSRLTGEFDATDRIGRR